MNDFTNDPRLTAFALGELPEAERAEVEALMARDEDVRRTIDEIRATANLVAAELGNAGGAALTISQREAIAAKAAVARPVRRMRPVYWAATAASVAAAVAGVAYVQSSAEKASAIDGFAQASPDNDQVTAVTRKANELSTRLGDLDKTKGFAEARLRQLQDSSGPLSSANQQTRAELEAIADPRRKLLSETRDEPVTFDEVFFGASGGVGGAQASGTAAYSEGGGGGGGGGVRTGGEAGANPDPDAPSGATGGTSIGVGTTDLLVRSSPSSFVERRGGGGGGLGQGGKAGAAPPKRKGPMLRDARAPADPPPLADGEGGGPSTPGAGGPTTGGPGAEEGEKLRRLQSLGYIGGGDRDGTTATYAHVDDNPFRLVKDAPLSTFGVDVDTASYSNVRRFLMSGQLPPPGAVRIEEMVNYFPYDYAPPSDGRPFAVRVDVAGCPWKSDHRLVRVGIKGKVVATAERPAANLVFLLDVSGSMQPQNRLPLVLQSMKLLVGQLEARDRVAIVVYAGESGLALPSTSCEDKGKILAALDALHAGGSTNGASGIQLAYDVAAQNRIDGGINRVVLATDGDFNVGVTDQSSLVRLVQEKAKAGTFLSVLGVGDDNYKDSTMEMLADRGNGNYAYIDSLKEGQKVLVAQTNGTLVTIAKDVKIQVEFNPAQVGSYRLIGYENRVLAAEDFRDDKKDAGEIGAGHTVTAIYEVVPPGSSATESVGVEPLKYQQQPAPAASGSRELLTVKLRWKEPNSDVSTPMEVPVIDEGISYSAASPDFKFAASVAAFGMVLRGSPHRGNVSLMGILELATEGAANDPGGHRAEFVTLLKRAVELGAK